MRRHNDNDVYDDEPVRFVPVSFVALREGEQGRLTDFISSAAKAEHPLPLPRHPQHHLPVVSLE